MLTNHKRSSLDENVTQVIELVHAAGGLSTATAQT
jgi:hypothetical protein